ncbi:hypothetical protein TcYC6_0110220 [Trypanosoma cruzi]|uniref:Uncharacterized protein n=1 Tax=Trypanosoma cruzi (strain CL Brener) TaxID=353153 RepID=Q4DJG5_TRYCC|nr:hypothetical protein, conserved [Trypanosoma cruzi]EAN92672.1 hypothetical protein, conserved [Trypanosoma cruzi]KAF8293429.1 hypothetical protein TcYC6_0110220 [Trypanosoma cruzi]RNC54530.1 hypothetical protein TcCL_ESM08031 [Trypanosoma cruzi]|eukprot:XP_814523.1 hypothetical protein [Trypanosoma cruzi strain CL Brener]
MREPYVPFRAVSTAWQVLPKHVEFLRVPRVVENRCELEARVMPLFGTTMHCEATHVLPHSIQTSGKRSAGDCTKEAASTISVETTAGIMIDVPVFSTSTSKSVHFTDINGSHGEKPFADISSVCSHDNTFLRDLDTGELLLPQPESPAFVGSKTGVRHALRRRRKRLVVLGDRRGRYQLVAVAIRRAADQRSVVGGQKDGR